MLSQWKTLFKISCCHLSLLHLLPVVEVKGVARLFQQASRKKSREQPRQVAAALMQLGCQCRWRRWKNGKCRVVSKEVDTGWTFAATLAKSDLNDCSWRVKSFARIFGSRKISSSYCLVSICEKVFSRKNIFQGFFLFWVEMFFSHTKKIKELWKDYPGKNFFFPADLMLYTQERK